MFGFDLGNISPLVICTKEYYEALEFIGIIRSSHIIIKNDGTVRIVIDHDDDTIRNLVYETLLTLQPSVNAWRYIWVKNNKQITRLIFATARTISGDNIIADIYIDPNECIISNTNNKLIEPHILIEYIKQILPIGDLDIWFSASSKIIKWHKTIIINAEMAEIITQYIYEITQKMRRSDN